MLKEFKEFALKGSVLDMAVGIIIGAAFGKIVSSLVNDVVMPPIGMLLGRVDFSNLYIDLSGPHRASLAAAKAAGDATVNFGVFINTILDFLVVSFVIFLLVRQVNRLRAQQAPSVTTKACPFCLSTIPLGASRCSHCTSELSAAA